MRTFLKENPEIADNIENQLRDLLIPKPKAEGESAPGAVEAEAEEA